MISRILTLVVLLSIFMAHNTFAEEQKCLKVSTKLSSFFVYKTNDTLQGLSVILSKRISEKLGYEKDPCFTVVPSIDNMVVDVNHNYDIAISAVSMTSDREKTVDQSLPYYDAGLTIATLDTELPWWKELWNLIVEIGSIIIGLLMFMLPMNLIIGYGICYFERNKNPDFQGPGFKTILFTGVYWAITTTTTTGFGDKAPITDKGKIFASMVMLISPLIWSIHSGIVSSTMTVMSLENQIYTPNDLLSEKVAGVYGTTSELFVNDKFAHGQMYDSIELAITALKNGEIKAVIYDQPTLKYHANNKLGEGKIEVMDNIFKKEKYVILVSNKKPKLKEKINQIILELLEEGYIEHLESSYLK